MQLQEPNQEPKLIFGLSPKATIIHAFVMAFLSQLFWALKFCEQIPAGIDYANPPQGLEFTDNVPWYYTLPCTILAVILASSWMDYKLSGATNAEERVKMSAHLYWKKMIYVVGGLVLFSSVAKFISLFIVLSFK